MGLELLPGVGLVQQMVLIGTEGPWVLGSLGPWAASLACAKQLWLGPVMVSF